MKILMLTLVLVTFAAPAFARCDHSYDRASDGSICGGRAADRRAGGR